MEGARKHAVQNARAIAEQAQTAKELDIGIRDIARLSGEVTAATSEQAQGLVVLVKDADEARRITRQTARALGEQADALDALAVGTVRQTASVKTLSSSTTEQVTATEQVSHAMRHVRSSIREIHQALAAQSKTATTTTADLEIVMREVGSLRAANAEQAELAAALLRGAGGNGTGEPAA
jgi:hypothetical protein